VGNKQEETASELIKELVLARWGGKPARRKLIGYACSLGAGFAKKKW